VAFLPSPKRSPPLLRGFLLHAAIWRCGDLTIEGLAWRYTFLTAKGGSLRGRQLNADLLCVMGLFASISKLIRPKAHRIDKWCPRCGEQLIARKFSRWEYNDAGERTCHSYGMEALCPQCGECTVDDPFVPTNSNPSQTVRPYREGWIQCPCCGWRFALHDKSSWAGEKHRKCGQRLVIDDA
jgi:hypothetical protein